MEKERRQVQWHARIKFIGLGKISQTIVIAEQHLTPSPLLGPHPALFQTLQISPPLRRNPGARIRHPSPPPPSRFDIQWHLDIGGNWNMWADTDFVFGSGVRLPASSPFKHQQSSRKRNIFQAFKGTEARDRIQIFWQKWLVQIINENLFVFWISTN